MSKIDEHIENRIKDAAKVEDVLTDALGVELRPNGANLEGLCPFHEDKHLGNFKVSPRRNICTCFACGKSWNAISLLMEGKNMKYPEALRWLAAKYGIYVDSDPVPQVKKAEPRSKIAQAPVVYWPITMTKSYMGHDEQNPLVKYLKALPLCDDDRKRLNNALQLYLVGTSVKGYTDGWSLWWYVDEQMRVRTGKLMAYMSNGHRDKTTNPTWVHSMLAKANMYDHEHTRVEPCLFGLHLLECFPDAEVCIVESEKSAIICSMFTDPNKRLWMATGGKSGLQRNKIQPLIDKHRYIVVYPDKDGYNDWKAMADYIGYRRLSVSNKVNELWVAQDGEKADIADIMLRQLHGFEETMAEKACRRLGLEMVDSNVQYMIEKLDLKLTD